MKVSIGLLVILLAAPCMGLGVSPSSLSYEINRGQTIQNNVLLSGVEAGTYLEISTDGKAAAWIQTDEYIVFPDKKQLELEFIIAVPKDAENGNYEGIIRISSMSEQTNNTNSLSLATAVDVKVLIKVSGKQSRELEIKSISSDKVGENEFIPLTIRVENSGTVKSSPGYARIYLSDKYYDVDISEMVEPQTVRDICVHLPVKLKSGQYQAHAEIYEEYMIYETDFIVSVLGANETIIRGELYEQPMQSWAMLGDIVKISAGFRNDGNIAMTVQTTAEVWKESRLIMLETDEKIVSAGEQEDFVFLFTPSIEGNYTILVNAEYNNEESGFEHPLEVEKPTEIRQTVKIEHITIGVLFVALVMVLLWRKR